MNEEQIAIASRLEELSKMIPGVEASGDPKMMENLNAEMQIASGRSMQLGMDPNKAVQALGKIRQQREQQEALGSAHNQGVQAGIQRGLQDGMKQGAEQEVLRRSGSANPQADVGVITNASRDLVEGITRQKKQREEQKMQAQQAQQQGVQ